LRCHRHVHACYRSILRRRADAGGFRHWVNRCMHGLSYPRMRHAFYHSREYHQRFRRPNFCRHRVRRLYITLLRRNPDRGGFNYWVGQCIRGRSIGSIRAAFIRSAEYRRIHRPRRPCFPAGSQVALPGGGTKAVEDLRHGDRVATMSTSGVVGSSEVFFFGHRDKAATSPFVCLAAADRRLCLSEDHYILASTSGSLASARQLRARSVRPGMTVWASRGNGTLSLDAVPVDRVEEEWRRGLYNPYVVDPEHLLVVDGVVASTHSYWFLDAVVSDDHAHWVPSVYDAVLRPARALYSLMGPQWAESVQDRLDLEGAATQDASLRSLVQPFAMVLSSEAGPIAHKLLATLRS